MSADVQRVALELSSNLDEQVRVWRRLLDLSLAQIEALQSQDVRSVHAILQELEVAMLDRSRAEVRRGMLLQQVAGVLGVPVDDVTRELIVSRLEPALGAAIDRAAEELRVLVGEMDEVVSRNRALLEHELAVVETLVQGMTVDHAVRPTYGKTGSQHEAPRLRLLDAQV